MATAVTASRSPLSFGSSRSPFAVPAEAGAHAEHRSLPQLMNRVLEELGNLRNNPGPETVHDLRVAIRRCRSLAAVMEAVDAEPAWPRMRKVARRLFRGLGAVRDAEVMAEWIGKLSPENDPLRSHLLANLEAGQKQRSEAALHAAAKFDAKEWLELENKLRKRVRLVPVGSLSAECLVLERLEEAKELHARALRTERARPWHELRIGIKRLRYTLESLLPEHYAVWRSNLKRLQDLLGDVHDLDVLMERIREEDAPDVSDAVKEWHARIFQARNERVETYRQLTLGKTSLWNEWRHNLPNGKRLEKAVGARIRATARAADSHPRRTGQVSRLALRVFDVLRRASGEPLFQEAKMRPALQTAARLHGISATGEHRLSQKAVRRHLLSLQVPPGWSAEQWDLMAWAVRFHRGPEPKEKNGFATLSEARQKAVRAMAGVLRLARALRKAGVESTRGLRAERSADAIAVRVPGLPDTAETAARIAAAKHLLESVLAKPLILKPVPRIEKAPKATKVEAEVVLTATESA